MNRSSRVYEVAGGAMFLSVLGGCFCGLGLQILPLWSWLEAVILPTVILLAFGADGLRAATRLRGSEEPPPDDERARIQHRRLGYMRAIAVAMLVLLVTVNLLAHSRHTQWMVPAVCLILGATLIAIATTGRPLFYRTGIAEIIAVLILLPTRPERRDVFTLIVTGVILWLSSITLLIMGRRAANQP